MTADAVRQALHNLRQRDLPSHAGRALTGVYESGRPDADALGREVIASFAATDGVDLAAYPSWMRMEQDLVALAGGLLDAPPGVVGSFTSGGSESTFLAVQTARDARPELRTPNVVLPTSASAAFAQAARYLRVEPVYVEVDPSSGRADAEAMTAALTSETILVVASAPSYAHGVVDPVGEIAAAAAERGVRCHVDAGVGGWLLPYLRRDDPSLPAFSFEVAGVTSISVDLHKYAYAPKGASLLLHRSAELRRPQFFSSAVGPGYPVVSSTAHGTRSGGPLAAAWAVTRFIGDRGYARLAAYVASGVQTVIHAVSQINGVQVIGHPDASVVALAIEGRCDVFNVCDELTSRGWHVEPQLSSGPFPRALHLVLSAATVPRLGEFLDAFKASVKTAAAAGPVRLPPELVDAVRTLDLRQFDDDTLDGLLDFIDVEIGPGMVLPDRMAPLNALLDVASPPVREAIMIGVLDRQSRARR
ncbi:MAG: aminotransferase class V-fold PLP-dependent enzyme [Propionibacteriaceae bacterium]